MTEQERDQILLNLLEAVTTMQNDVATLKADVATLKADVAILKAEVGTLKTEVGTLKTEVGTLKTEVGTLKADVATLKADVSGLKAENRSLSRSIAVIEVEHGNKIQLLLDGQVSILAKLNSFQERFVSDEEELENHSNRIWNLENHVGII